MGGVGTRGPLGVGNRMGLGGGNEKERDGEGKGRKGGNGTKGIPPARSQTIGSNAKATDQRGSEQGLS